MNIENFAYHSFRDGRLVTVSTPPARARQRKQFSCIACHRQKIKCDRDRPCNQCVASRRREECRYKSDGLKTTGQLLLKENSNHENNELLIPSTGTAHVAQCQPMFRRDAHADERDDSAEQLDRDPPFTLYQQGKAKFKGPTHWSLLASEFKELTPFWFGSGDIPGFSGMSAQLKESKLLYDHRVKRSRNYPFGDVRSSNILWTTPILSLLPPRELVEAYVDNYLRTFERTHRLLNYHTFKEELRCFWEAPDSVDDSWSAQLLMMLALGCPRGQREENTTLVDTFLDGAEACLSRTRFMFKPNLAVIRTMCMMAIAKQIDIISFDDSDAVWALMGFIMRLAMIMGLHRDPGYFHGMPPLEQEMRKRVWATIVFMNLQNAMESGMPLLLNALDFDSAPPSNFNDNDLLADNPIPKRLDVFTDSSFQILLAQSFSTTLEIIHMANSTSPGICHNKILQYDAKVRNLFQAAQKTFHEAQSNNKALDSRCIMLQETILEIYYRRVLLALHRQHFLSPRAPDTCPDLYWGSIECSFALIVLQRTFYEGTDDPAIEWFAELFKGDFFVAALYAALGLRQHTFAATSNDRFQLPEKQTVTLALKACLDIWKRKIHISTDHFKAHLVLAMIVRALETRAGGLDLAAEMRDAAGSTVHAVETAMAWKASAVALTGPSLPYSNGYKYLVSSTPDSMGNSPAAGSAPETYRQDPGFNRATNQSWMETSLDLENFILGDLPFSGSLGK